MELIGQTLIGYLPQGVFNELARVAALGACEAFRFDAGLAIWRNDDFDGFQIAPPTFTVSLIEPSASGCSVTL